MERPEELIARLVDYIAIEIQYGKRLPFVCLEYAAEKTGYSLEDVEEVSNTLYSMLNFIYEGNGTALTSKILEKYPILDEEYLTWVALYVMKKEKLITRSIDEFFESVSSSKERMEEYSGIAEEQKCVSLTEFLERFDLNEEQMSN